MNKLEKGTLEDVAKRIRRHIVEMTGLAGSGHPGGSLSSVEIVTTLFFEVMKHDPSNPKWRERDRFILSKGHAAPCLYAVLAESGYFPVSDLKNLRKLGCHLQGHPDMCRTPGVEISTGSLGQGLSIAVGAALAGRLDGIPYNVFVLIGDGESQEGQVWEAAMSAGHYRLGSIIAFVDNNGWQIDGKVDDIMGLEPMADKWSSFGWHVQNIDGHSPGQIISAIKEAKKVLDRPSVIIAKTVKGKGISFMENNNEFHGKAPTKEQMELALNELQ